MTASDVSRIAFVLVCSLTTMGCFITREPSYQAPENLPASVLGSPETPMSNIVRFPVSTTPSGDAGVGTDPEFVATVRDVNVGDDLEGLVFLDRLSNVAGSGFIRQVDIPPEVDEDRLDRRVTFTIPRVRFTPGCHRVELHVSRAFNRFPDLSPADTTDLGVGVWWVAAYDTSENVNMFDCPRDE